MSISCKLLGHKLDVCAAYYYSVYRCQRCGAALDDEGLREWVKVRLHLIRCWLGRQYHYIRCWLKCYECGLWFGKHDDSDHLPF